MRYPVGVGRAAARVTPSWSGWTSAGAVAVRTAASSRSAQPGRRAGSARVVDHAAELAHVTHARLLIICARHDIDERALGTDVDRLRGTTPTDAILRTAHQHAIAHGAVSRRGASSASGENGKTSAPAARA